MKYLQRSFTVKMGENEAFRSNYDRIFAKTPSEAVLSASEPVLSATEPVLSATEPVKIEPLPDPLQRDMRAVLIYLPVADRDALREWADKTASEPLDPDVAHTVLMAVADAVTSP